jgi:hypothetical protein
MFALIWTVRQFEQDPPNFITIITTAIKKHFPSAALGFPLQ